MLRLSVRDALAHRARVAATFLAVVLGVAFMTGTLVLGDTVGAGFDAVFTDVYARVDAVVRSDDVIETDFGGERATIDAAVADQVAAVDGVAAVAAQVQGTVSVIGPDGEPLRDPRRGIPTLGLGWITAPELNGWTVVDGRPPAADGEVVLDRATAVDAGVGPGDHVDVVVPSGTLDVEVVGVARFGELDDFSGAAAVLFTDAAAQALLTEPGQVEWISVAAEPGVGEDELVAALAAELGPTAGAEVLTGAEFTEESQNVFGRFVDAFTYLLFGFGVVAMFVGMFIIANTFTIIVAQRTRELALLRAVGASRRQILGSVVTEALVLGLVAAAVGAVAGVGVAAGLRSLLEATGFELPPTPLAVSPVRLLLPVALATTMTVLAALAPAVRATRIPPVAAMRDVAIDRPAHLGTRAAVAAVLLAVGAELTRRGLAAGDRLAVVWVLGASIPAFLAVFALGPFVSRPLARMVGAPLARWRGITGTLARENSLRNPTRTATTAIALTIGVGLISVIAVAGESLRASVDVAIDGGVDADFVVTAQSFAGVSPRLATDLAALDEVAVATGVRFENLEVDGERAFVGAIDPSAITEVLDLDVRDGDLGALGGDELAVSATVAEREGWAVGDEVPVRFVGGDERPFRIAAVFGAETFQRGGGILVAQETFDAEVPDAERADQQVYVVLRDGVDVDDATPALEAVMAGYPTADLADLEGFKAAQTERITQQLTFLYALLGLAVVVGIIGVVNTLLLSVVERTREIGLLRAVGTSRGQIRSTVLGESVIIALIGTVPGLAIGLVLGWAMVSSIQLGVPTTYAVPVAQLVVFVGAAVVAGIVAGVWPASRAARLGVLAAISVE